MCIRTFQRDKKRRPGALLVFVCTRVYVYVCVFTQYMHSPVGVRDMACMRVFLSDQEALT